ncbi:bacterial regulatory, tetR family protein [Pseudomonas aeruginosa]|nr:bacterial regulatory, tetR family protein [Pseudomonas aeruginosa]PRW09008.1 bacterial regulatory, tetR family protein [Pseudomonas aeruginosa]
MARKTKEESQKTRDGILDAAERVFLEKGVGTTAMADLADAAGVSRGAVYGHYKNKIEVCLAMCDRAFGQIEVPDENARVPALDILLRAGMGFLRQCCEPGSVQRVLEILYLKCERSDENEPLLRRRELLEKQGQRFGLRQIRRAVERGELPGRRAGQHLSAIALGRHLRHPGLDRAPARRSLEPRRTHVPRRPRQPAQFSLPVAGGRLRASIVRHQVPALVLGAGDHQPLGVFLADVQALAVDVEHRQARLGVGTDAQAVDRRAMPAAFDLHAADALFRIDFDGHGSLLFFPPTLGGPRASARVLSR